MRNETFRKGLVCGIFLLFVGISIIPMAGSLGIKKYVSTENTSTDCSILNNDPSCYPVFDGTMGENDWYVSCITISFVYDPQEIAAVYFGFDSGSWQIYTAPFEVCWDGEHTFCWYYIDKEGNQSAIECIELKIDLIPPTIDLTWESWNQNGIWEILFTATCSDGPSGMDRVEFFIEDVYQFTDYAKPYEWMIEWNTSLEGSSFYAYAYDKAGNMNEDAIYHSESNIGSPYIESSIIGLIGNPEFSRQNVGPNHLPSTESIVAEKYVSTDNQICKSNSRNDNDTTPPVTTIYFDPPYPDGDNGWYVSDVTITLEATDDMSGVDFIKYLLDDNDWLTYTGPFTVESDGYHRITYYAVDKAGNVEQPSEVIRFGIDQTPPTIELTWEVRGCFEVIFTVICSDATSGMDRVEFYINDVLMFIDDMEPYVWILDQRGPYTYKFTAFDNAGNSAFVILDDDDIYSNSQSSSSQQFSSSSSSQSSKSVIPTTGTEIVENKNVENNVRNTFLRGAELEVTTDKDVYDPGETVTIYLTNIDDEILYGGGPLITIYNEDDEIVFEEATYCWHELEPEEYITWTWDQTDQQGSQVPNGFYVVEGALYGVGETFVDSSIIAVTEEDLVVHIDGIEGENGWYISCVTITVLYDPEAIKEVYVNGEIYLEPVVICEDGEHDVEITAVDWDGNWMSPMSICFWIDKTPPWIDLTWEASGNNIIGWKVKWTATCSDAMSGMDGVYFRINNVVQFTDYEAPYEWVIEWSSVLEGVMFSATAFDNAGNSAWEWACPPEIQLHSNSQSNQQSSQQSSNPLFFQILERLLGYQ